MIIRPLTIMAEKFVPPFPYQTIQIGNQIWMAENLHEDDGGEGIDVFHNTVINGYTYPTIYMYSYAAAMRIANSIQGWHLPTVAEVNTLAQYVNGGYGNGLGTKLKSTTGWNNNGTDDYGWNAKPLGIVRSSYSPGGEFTIWEQDTSGSRSYRWYITETYSANGTEYAHYKYSVRLIKDA